MDFLDAEARTVAERRREEERQRKMARIYKERVEAASKDMEGEHTAAFSSTALEKSLHTPLSVELWFLCHRVAAGHPGHFDRNGVVHEAAHPWI